MTECRQRSGAARPRPMTMQHLSHDEKRALGFCGVCPRPISDLRAGGSASGLARLVERDTGMGTSESSHRAGNHLSRQIEVNRARTSSNSLAKGDVHECGDSLDRLSWRRPTCTAAQSDSTCASSWKSPMFRRRSSAEPPITSNGQQFTCAFATAVSVLVCPTPDAAMHTPTPRVK